MPSDPTSRISTANLPENVAAFFAAFFPPLSGIFFLVYEKKNRLVRFYAMQSVVFGLFVVVGYLAIVFLVPVVRGRSPEAETWLALVAYLFVLVWIAVWIVSIVAAFCSKEWEIPVFGRIARRRLAKISAAEEGERR